MKSAPVLFLWPLYTIIPERSHGPEWAYRTSICTHIHTSICYIQYMVKKYIKPGYFISLQFLPVEYPSITLYYCKILAFFFVQVQVSKSREYSSCQWQDFFFSRIVNENLYLPCTVLDTHTHTQARTYEARAHADTHTYIHPHILTQRLVVCKPYCRATCYKWSQWQSRVMDALLGIRLPPPMSDSQTCGPHPLPSPPGAPCQWSCSLSHTSHMWSSLALTCRLHYRDKLDHWHCGLFQWGLVQKYTFRVYCCKNNRTSMHWNNPWCRW